MTENYRNDNNNFVNDFNLNTVPTYNVNHKNGVKTNWLHHTYPNEIFNTPSNVEKAKKAIEHLLWKGLSKLKDTIETLTNTIVNDESKTKQWKLRIVENYIVSLKQIISSYNDFYLQVCNNTNCNTYSRTTVALLVTTSSIIITEVINYNYISLVNKS